MFVQGRTKFHDDCSSETYPIQYIYYVNCLPCRKRYCRLSSCLSIRLLLVWQLLKKSRKIQGILKKETKEVRRSRSDRFLPPRIDKNNTRKRKEKHVQFTLPKTDDDRGGKGGEHVVAMANPRLEQVRPFVIWAGFLAKHSHLPRL